MTYLTAWSNFATKAFIREKATMMGILQHVVCKLVDIVNLMRK